LLPLTCGYATGRVGDVRLDIDLPFGLQTGRSFQCSG
jgi:hypothetical protein